MSAYAMTAGDQTLTVDTKHGIVNLELRTHYAAPSYVSLTPAEAEELADALYIAAGECRSPNVPLREILGFLERNGRAE